jgi:hypothetical protein
LQRASDNAATDAARRHAQERIQEKIQWTRGQLPHAIRHASLWRAVQPLQDALQGMGFNGALLRFQLPGDDQVRQVLRGWAELMDDQRIFSVYQSLQARAEAMPKEQALRLWVHGKLFWRHVVAPALGETSEAKLRRLLLRRMALPEDMRVLLERVFAGDES